MKSVRSLITVCTLSAATVSGLAPSKALTEVADVTLGSMEVCTAARDDVHSVEADLVALGWKSIAPSELTVDQGMLLASTSALLRFDSRVDPTSYEPGQWKTSWELVHKGAVGFGKLKVLDSDDRHTRYLVWPGNSSVLRVISQKFPKVLNVNCDLIVTPDLMPSLLHSFERSSGKQLGELPPVFDVNMNWSADAKNDRGGYFYLLDANEISSLIDHPFTATAFAATYWRLVLEPEVTP